MQTGRAILSMNRKRAVCRLRGGVVVICAGRASWCYKPEFCRDLSDVGWDFHKFNDKHTQAFGQKCRAPLLAQLPADQLQQQMQGPVDRR